MTNTLSLAPVGCPKGVVPHEWRKAVAARIDALADQMTALIEALDQMDGDADLEPAGDELDVSWPEGCRPFDTSLGEDAENDDPAEDDDAGEDIGDDEPSLAGPGVYRAGIVEHDLEADDADNEPFLGWSEAQSEHGAVASGTEFGAGEFARLEFTGTGYHYANAILRSKGLLTVRVRPGL
jgi:hypothetical protein